MGSFSRWLVSQNFSAGLSSPPDENLHALQVIRFGGPFWFEVFLLKWIFKMWGPGYFYNNLQSLHFNLQS